MLTFTSSGGNSTIVNAAFLQEVKDSNTRLWSVLHELRDMHPGEEETRELSRRLVTGLGELRDCIALEFSLEETYGFLTVHNRSPACGPVDAAVAKMQHRELYLQLHELCETVEEAQYRGTIGRDLNQYLGDFGDFDLAFRAHEELESELIRFALGQRAIARNTPK